MYLLNAVMKKHLHSVRDGPESEWIQTVPSRGDEIVYPGRICHSDFIDTSWSFHHGILFEQTMEQCHCRTAD